MALLDNQVSQQVSQFFQSMQDSVTIEFFAGPEAEMAETFSELINEVADLSDLVMVKTTDTAPILEPGHGGNETITGPVAELLDNTGRHTGVRFLGIPSGHEFGAFLEALKAVSTHTSTLSEKAREQLATIQNPLHIQVFTTPT
ncbi:MAG: hypothetical protein C7B46_14815 [Sulfobacillus benefaciens]|uniref:Uncharacterized protein n=1 Tax=Sulfobacillus benefaciens TaxID=453960 RepID=A0A2T2XD35_9FIRM|nr:MAG: hypothetical protein C7B46_14815 [Sulfobacillus benefaciens]